MNFKQLAGLILVAAGIVLIVLAFHTKHQIIEAKTWTDHASEFFKQNPTWNPIIEFFGGTPEKKPPEYTPTILRNLIAGIALILCGGVIAIVCRTRKW